MRGRWLVPAVLAAVALPARAQIPLPRKPTLAAPGTTAQPGTPRSPRDSLSDTAKVGRGAGLPSGPSRTFPEADSVERELLAQLGFRVTRYSADSVQFLPPEKEIRMSGQALVSRDSSILQADTINYQQSNCALHAAGSPQLFDQTGVMIGHGMLYDACNHAGIIGRATTDFKEDAATWYLRGDLAVDNEENRVYAAGSNITSCDLPDPHYHFAAREVKWVSKTLMVARPAVLYVADVPIIWLPFIFQDMRHGRRSGLIPPQFGLSDIVRNSPTYHRHITNLGYYWAINDYTDAQATVDWYAQQNVSLDARFRYKWLNRFMTGAIAFSDIHEFNGSTSERIQWVHTQDFSLESHLNASIDYATSSQVISRNAVDPILAVSNIDSRVNFSQRFPWGSLNVGGSRTQSLSTSEVSTTFPTVAFTPNPIAISEAVTWSPSFSLSNALLSHGAPGSPAVSTIYGSTPADSSLRYTDNRQTQVSITTPLRVGRWNWSNSVQLSDQWSNLRVVDTIADPADTTRRLVRTYDQTFETDIDWSTGIGLPLLLQGSWNLQPSVNIVNTTSGPFMIRNRFTGGAYVTQGKRLGYSLALSPTFFGLFPGIGPIARIRHSISPSISWSYAPAASIPLAYARALAAGGPVTTTRSLATQTLNFGLSQNFEAKLKPPPLPPGADTAGAPPPEARKIKLLSITTSGIGVDLEQAKQKGKSGWVTGSLTNTFSTDLLPGFSFSTAHSLFDGPTGTASSRFHPYLTSVSARFGLGPSLLRWVGSLLGLVSQPATPAQGARKDSTRAGPDTMALPHLFPDVNQRGPLTTPTALDQLAPRGGGASGFSASLAFDLSRQRPIDSAVAARTGQAVFVPVPQSTISGSIHFQPTRHWSVSWETLYDLHAGKFGSHVLRLDRDLHDWRATFSFVQSPNGNVVFNFNIALIPQPEIKFDYDQRNLPAQ
ncbi:MAG TPA: putative LPS assembly protein LptD [Gemmatimonadales bacterium]|nr:putative LPS assembly protein LptD [Gemmatimonadales bacterium]